MLSLAIATLVLGMVNAIDWNAVIRRSMAKSGYTFKEACAEMRIAESQFSEQLAGIGHLSLKRLGQLGPAFHRWFAIEIAREVGIPEELHIARRLEAAAFTDERIAS